MPDVHVGPLTAGQGAACERILRGLPEWFGLEDAIFRYVEEVPRMTCLAATAGGALVGFLALRRHNHATAEVHVMGVLSELHRRGIGRQLVEAAAERARADGCRLLSVKTLAASRACAEYERTRLFYESLGFLPVEEFATLWGEANPCLLMVRPLDAGASR